MFSEDFVEQDEELSLPAKILLVLSLSESDRLI